MVYYLNVHVRFTDSTCVKNIQHTTTLATMRFIL